LTKLVPGIKLFPVDKFSKYPLDYAKENGHKEIAKLLADFQGKINFTVDNNLIKIKK
jgi:hypothetical protein